MAQWHQRATLAVVGSCNVIAEPERRSRHNGAVKGLWYRKMFTWGEKNEKKREAGIIRKKDIYWVRPEQWADSLTYNQTIQEIQNLIIKMESTAEWKISHKLTKFGCSLQKSGFYLSRNHKIQKWMIQNLIGSIYLSQNLAWPYVTLAAFFPVPGWDKFNPFREWCYLLLYYWLKQLLHLLYWIKSPFAIKVTDNDECSLFRISFLIMACVIF